MNAPVPVPVHALTAEQLRAYPVWAYMLDAEGDADSDESYVSAQAAPPARSSHGSYVVSATFLLRGGDQLPGAVQVDQLGTKRLFTPILIHAAGKSLDPLASDITTHLARLRKSAAEPPVRWRLNMTLPGDQAPASGRISGSRTVQALGLLLRMIWLSFTSRRR